MGRMSWDEVIGDSDSSSNNQSWLARVGRYGQEYLHPFSYFKETRGLLDYPVKWADKGNKFFSKIAKKDPVVQFDRRNNPIQDTEEGKHLGDWAENKPLDSTAIVLGSIFGGGALLGAGGGGAGAGSGLGGGGAATGAGLGTPAGMTAAGFMPGSAATGAAGLEGVTVLGSAGGAAMSPGTAAALAAAGAGAPAASGNQGTNWRDLLDNMPNQQQQQQQTQQQQPVGARPVGMIEKIRRGLGQTGERMFPIDSAYGLEKQQQQAMRKNALLQMGLGMMSASGQGAGFGEAAAFGLGKAQQNLTGALQQGYETARANRQEQRQTDRDRVADERFAAEMDYRSAQAEAQREDRRLQLEQRNSEQEAMRDYRDQSLELQRQNMEQQREMQRQQLDTQKIIAEMRSRGVSGFGKPPAGYQWKPDGTLEAIPGGPATKLPTDAAAKKSMLEQADKGITDAVEILFDENGSLNRGAVASGQAGLPWSEGRQAQQRIRVAVESALRAQTGAAAPEQEVTRYTDMFTPSVLDNDETARAKVQALREFINQTQVNLQQGRGGQPEQGGGVDATYIPGRGLVRQPQ